MSSLSRAVIRRVEISATPEQILEIARQALSSGVGDPDDFVHWFVAVDGRQVGAKWLVSQLSGLATTDFRAHEAVRVLRKLNVIVRRI